MTQSRRRATGSDAGAARRTNTRASTNAGRASATVRPAHRRQHGRGACFCLGDQQPTCPLISCLLRPTTSPAQRAINRARAGAFRGDDTPSAPSVGRSALEPPTIRASLSSVSAEPSTSVFSATFSSSPRRISGLDPVGATPRAYLQVFSDGANRDRTGALCLQIGSAASAEQPFLAPELVIDTIGRVRDEGRFVPISALLGT